MSENVFPVDPIFYMPIDTEDNKEKQQKTDTIKQDENNNNEKNILTFSINKNDKNIKSLTNSSKIYISEIFKKNWKLKSRRLLSKLKKKLIKQLIEYQLKENINEKSNFINNNIVNQIYYKYPCRTNRKILNIKRVGETNI